MGISPSIRDLEAKDQQFHRYLSEVRSELGAQTNDMNRRIADLAASWKAANADAKLLASGANLDLQDSAFSPDSLQGPVKATVSAVFTGSPAPAGVTVEHPVQQNVTKTLASAVPDLSYPESIVFGKAVDAIGTIVHGFGNPSAASFTSSVVSQPLGLGLHMFLGVSERILTSTGLSDNRNIYAYVFTYQVYYSEKEAAEFSRQAVLEGLVEQLTAFQHKLMAIPVPDPPGGEAMEKYQALTAWYTSHIADVQAQIEQLRAQPS